MSLGPFKRPQGLVVAWSSTWHLRVLWEPRPPAWPLWPYSGLDSCKALKGLIGAQPLYGPYLGPMPDVFKSLPKAPHHLF